MAGRMVRFFASACVVVAVVTTVTGGSVAGAADPTATPVPTATPTATSVPKASRVLGLMMQAWQAAGSEHFSITEKTTWTDKNGTQRATSTQTGDVAWQNPPIFEMRGPLMERVKKGSDYIIVKVSETQIYVHNRLAVKIGLGKWSCNNFYGFSDLPGDPNSSGSAPDGLVGKDLGIKTVDGVPAWHVRSEYTVPGPTGSTHPKTRQIRNYFAAVANYRPVEFHIYGESYKKGTLTRGSEIMRFSNFGETVHVTLPSACKK